MGTLVRDVGGDVIPDMARLKQPLSRVFAPPNKAYRVRSRFLATRQGKKELVDYVQELRTLIAGMAVDPLPEAVTVTVFMEGLRTGVARTEVFRTHPTSFEEAVNVALNAEFNFKSSRLGWNASYANPSSGPEPMDLSYAEDEEAELLAAEQHFGSVERCLALDLDARYDLILGMAWLERHGPWINWRSKTLGATHFSPSGALASHELTSARNEARMDDEPSLGAKDGVIGVMPKTQGRSPAVECGVAHNPLSGGCGQSSTSLSVGRDTGAPSDLEEVMAPESAAGAVTTASRRLTTSAKRRRRRRMLAARRMALGMSRDMTGVASGTALHDSEQLYTLVNGVTGDVDGDVNLGTVPTLAALLELDEMSFDGFGEALQAGELAEVVVIRPEEELNSSSLLDEAVHEDAKKALNTRSGSEILKNPSDPFYPKIREFQDGVSKEPPSGLPPDRGVRHEIDLVPGTKYCVTRQWPLPREQCDVIDAFFRAKHEAGLVRESKSPHSTPTFCVRKPNGKWTIVHAFNKLNAATIPAHTPIPRKDVLQNNMAGCTLYSVLDLSTGLSNEPATINRLVTQLFRPHRAYAQMYFDDIFVHSRAELGKTDVENHVEQLRAVLECMPTNQLYANIDKCIFGAEEIPFVGCFIGKHRLRADPAKVKAIAEWPVPRNQKDLRKWLGLANYLHNLLHAPILALPDPDGQFSVVCDASDFAIGCALLQADAEGRERVIAFESRQLKASEKNYPVHDKELLAMKYALVKFRVHLFGSKPFVIYTDHASLRTATQSPHLSQRMAQ
ncbi:unnamed protein product [Phytophthora fragariaefolia]|uniref:Unnamed protein product n=1 Tax=Phytophthora fragariaefolia TaxID=1490495 RepID=A0A9W6XIV2_9STRA|nr:unnamed protein product [Phytophthora fragariaefolia]